MNSEYDILIIGDSPAGIVCGIALKKGVKHLVIDKSEFPNNC